MVFRILFSIFLLASVLFAPFWASAILAILGMIYFPLFIEGVVLMGASDLVYGTGEAKLLNLVFVSSTISVIALILVETTKKKLKFYQK